MVTYRYLKGDDGEGSDECEGQKYDHQIEKKVGSGGDAYDAEGASGGDRH